ncbi:MAG: hypothetical protein IPJ27_05235 [Candidatus Accumulibacter sp.]|uniref:Uncharacterized protein n=2 Tax=Candidatus Accumulibacter TaxID=327159 RepID=A0A935PZJ9_9PROT|nr:hypothetical protein [Candidatus Accumulibacter proximus]
MSAMLLTLPIGTSPSMQRFITWLRVNEPTHSMTTRLTSSRAARRFR